MLSATTATGLLIGSRFVNLIFTSLEIIFPFYLLGRNGLIGVMANFPELRDKIGP